MIRRLGLAVSLLALCSPRGRALAQASRPTLSPDGGDFSPLFYEPTEADRQFGGFVERYFKGYFDFRPGQATDLGLHDRDDRLPDLSRASITREVERLRAAGRELTAIDGDQLNKVSSIDRRLILSSIDAELLDLRDLEAWRHKPAFYGDQISWAIYTLVKREFAPAPVRLAKVIARERQVAGVLAAAQANLDNPPHLWVEVAIDDTQGTIDFLQKDVPGALAGVGDAALQADFAESTKAAVAALQSYKAWLKDQLLPRAKGDFVLGEERFRKKLLFEEMVDLPINRLLDMGYAELRRQQRLFEETARQIDPSQPGTAVLAKLAHHHSAPQKLIAETQGLMGELRDFLVSHGIVDLPSDRLPIVAETPPFARAFSFASMDTPGAFEKHATQAYFYLTLPEAAWTPEHVEEHMQAYWRGDLVNTAIHEAYPGHYLQYLWLPFSPSYTRKILGANTFIEGWAHYTEEMLLEQGYGHQAPELWLSAEQWALVRCARYIAGILMHTRGMSLEQATSFFEQEAYLTPANAKREAQRGTADPTYLYYTLGALQIRELRRDVAAIEGPRFSLKRFHDRLLSQGFMPMALTREALGLAMEADEDELEAEQQDAAAGRPLPGEIDPAKTPLGVLPAPAH